MSLIGRFCCKSIFGGADRKFPEPLMRLAPRDVRDLIILRQNDRRPFIGGTEHHSGEVAEGSAFARFLRSLDFRLLQQNWHFSDLRHPVGDVR